LFLETQLQLVLLWLAALLPLIYGSLTAFAGLGQFRAGRIQSWAAVGMIVCGLAVVAAALLTVLLRWVPAVWLMALALVGIHVLAVNNGRVMFGRLNPTHHLARLIISILLLWMTYTALN
jgi:hypothetical protein